MALMNEIFVARNEFAAVLTQLGGREVRDHPRSVVGEDRRVHLVESRSRSLPGLPSATP